MSRRKQTPTTGSKNVRSRKTPETPEGASLSSQACFECAGRSCRTRHTVGSELSKTSKRRTQEELAEKYVAATLLLKNPDPAQTELAEKTGIPQPSWSRFLRFRRNLELISEHLRIGLEKREEERNLLGKAAKVVVEKIEEKERKCYEAETPDVMEDILPSLGTSDPHDEEAARMTNKQLLREIETLRPELKERLSVILRAVYSKIE